LLVFAPFYKKKLFARQHRPKLCRNAGVLAGIWTRSRKPLQLCVAASNWKLQAKHRGSFEKEDLELCCLCWCWNKKNALG